MFFLESNAQVLPKEGIFVLIGVAFFVVLYFVLSAVRVRKRKECPLEAAETENEEETVAAITAAISVILKTEAESEARKPNSFRVVAFKRTNSRKAEVDNEKV